MRPTRPQRAAWQKRKARRAGDTKQWRAEASFVDTETGKIRVREFFVWASNKTRARHEANKAAAKFGPQSLLNSISEEK